MNPSNSFTRDYRDRPYWSKPKFSSFDDAKPETSQDSINNDLPSWPWIISGCLVAVGVFFIWVWLLAILLDPQTTPDTLAVYNPDLPISEYNNEHTALSLTPSSVLPRRMSGALPDGNGLSSPSESVFTPPISVSPSAVSQPLYEGAFYSDTSELMEISGVLLNPNVNDGWED